MGNNIYIYIYTHLVTSTGNLPELWPRRSLACGLLVCRLAVTVDFRNFIVLFWAETLAH